MESRKTNEFEKGAPDVYDPLLGCPCEWATKLTFSGEGCWGLLYQGSRVVSLQCTLPRFAPFLFSSSRSNVLLVFIAHILLLHHFFPLSQFLSFKFFSVRCPVRSSVLSFSNSHSRPTLWSLFLLSNLGGPLGGLGVFPSPSNLLDYWLAFTWANRAFRRASYKKKKKKKKKKMIDHQINEWSRYDSDA